MAMKKALSLVVSLALALTLSAGARAYSDADYPDVPQGWSHDAVVAAIENGLIQGDESGRINPTGTLTRAQAAAVLVRAMGATQAADISDYLDMDAGKWYYREMAIAVNMGCMQGSDHLMQPDKAMTREMLAVVLARLLKLTPDTSVLERFSDGQTVSDWAVDGVSAMVAAGYMQGDQSKLNPRANLTREEFAQFLYNIVKQYVDETGEYNQDQTGNLLIRNPDVVLKGIHVTGDLIIGDGVGDGDVTLDGCKVDGRLLVRGGGANSIRLVGSNVGHIYVAKSADGALRVAVDENSKVETVYLNDGKDTIILECNADNLVVDASVEVELTGQIGSLVATADDVKLTLSEGTEVANMTINGNNNAVSGDGKIVTLVVEAPVSVAIDSKAETVVTEADNVQISLGDSAEIKSLNVNGADSAITGNGKVETATITGSNATVESPNTEIVNLSDTKVTTPAGEVPSGSVQTPEESGGGSTGGGTGGSTGGGSGGGSGQPDVRPSYYTMGITLSDGQTSVNMTEESLVSFASFLATVLEMFTDNEIAIKNAFSGQDAYDTLMNGNNAFLSTDEGAWTAFYNQYKDVVRGLEPFANKSVTIGQLIGQRKLSYTLGSVTYTMSISIR